VGYRVLLVPTRRLDSLWQRILVALRRDTRQKEGRDPKASAAIMDSQSVRIAEESDGNKGYDAGENVPGRKRHLLVDTSGLLLASRVTPANISDNGCKISEISLSATQRR